MEQQTNQYNPMQIIKRRFFAMRNGVVDDVLRRGGSPYRIIFGLNLPQIVEIASSTESSRDLAEALWANDTTRESRLAAPMIMPREDFPIEDARRWVSTILDRETADILCHRLLRHTPYARELARELSKLDGMALYTGIRLAANLVYTHTDEAAEIASDVLSKSPDQQIGQIARQIIEEKEFLKA